MRCRLPRLHRRLSMRAPLRQSTPHQPRQALLAAMTIFVGARYGMRNQGQTARNAWLVRHFPDVRGAMVAYQSVRESGCWERLGITVLATVLSSILTWMLGIDSGIEIFNYSVGGLVFLNVSVRAFG